MNPTPAPRPVYTGKVVTLHCVDRIGKPFTSTFPAGKLLDRLAMRKAAGDTVTHISSPYDNPNIIPAATGKTIQQERAEVAAEKRKKQGKKLPKPVDA